MSGPSLAPVARLYRQGRYRRASVLPGPGVALVPLSDAAEWRQVAELRARSLDEVTAQRDASRAALAELVRVLRERHYGRMPEEVQRAYDAAAAIVRGEG